MNVIQWHGPLVGLRSRNLQVRIREEKQRYCWFKVALLDKGLRVVDVSKWYQSHGFDNETGWAMLVVNDKNILEQIVVERYKN
jgi:hypothetical protein